MEWPIFYDFYNKVIEEIENDIEYDTSPSILKCKKMLLVKSVRDDAFEETIAEIRDINSEIEIFVLGDVTETDFVRIGIESEHLINHKGRFSANDNVDAYVSLIEEEGIDIVMYINYATFRASYINVMNFVGSIARNVEVKTMAYNVNDKLFVEHGNIEKFAGDLQFLIPLVEYGDRLFSKLQ